MTKNAWKLENVPSCFVDPDGRKRTLKTGQIRIRNYLSGPGSDILTQETVPEAYLTHFSYRCWFLNCSVERAVWRGGGGGRDYLCKIRLRWYIIIFKKILHSRSTHPYSQGRAGHWKGWALKLVLIKWRLILMRANPLLGPCNGCLPHQNHYVPRLINNRYNNS